MYDPAGNLTALTDNAGTRTAAYAYDDLGRLTGVTWPDGTRSWEYDAIGNVTRLSVDTGLPGEGQVDYAYDVNPSGNNTPLLTTVAATSGGSPLWTSTLNTDPAGNITTDGASIYDYDLRNLLGDRQLPTATSQHTFDASGQRVETVRSDTGAATELILGPAGERLAKLEDTTWRDYVWLGNRLIAYFDQGQPDPTLVFTNHIGMPLLATDGAGAPVWEAKAEPYGQLRGAVNKTHDPGLRYPGQWQDELDLESTCTGDDCTLPGPLEQSFSLFENGYRWYRPDWGRYTQADPVGLGGGLNLYLYARSNPFRYADTYGLEIIEAACAKDEGCKLRERRRIVSKLQGWYLDMEKRPLDFEPRLGAITACAFRKGKPGFAKTDWDNSLGKGTCLDLCTRVHEQVHRDVCTKYTLEDVVSGRASLDLSDEPLAYLREYECLLEAELNGRVRVNVDPLR